MRPELEHDRIPRLRQGVFPGRAGHPVTPRGIIDEAADRLGEAFRRVFGIAFGAAIALGALTVLSSLGFVGATF